MDLATITLKRPNGASLTFHLDLESLEVSYLGKKLGYIITPLNQGSIKLDLIPSTAGIISPYFKDGGYDQVSREIFTGSSSGHISS